MRRRLLRLAGVVFLALVFLATAASLALRLTLSPELLREQILPRLTALTGREAGLGQATVSLLRGLVIKDFYMLDPAPSDLESVGFERAIVRVSLWDLLQQRLDVQSIDLGAPHVEIVIHPDGSTNFRDVFAHLRGEAPADAAVAEAPVATAGRADQPEPGQGAGRRSEEPLNIERIRVRGGSVTVNRQGEESSEDRYLDITDLSMDIGPIRPGARVTFSVAGNVGVERQAPFSIRGHFDPSQRLLESEVEVPVLRSALLNSLLEFVQLQALELTGGDVEDVRLLVRAPLGRVLGGPEAASESGIELAGEIELDDVEAETALARLKLDGPAALEASLVFPGPRLAVRRADLVLDRPGEDGALSARGEIDLGRGEGELRLVGEGLEADTLASVGRSWVRLQGEEARLRLAATLALSEGFGLWQATGSAEATATELAVPSVLGRSVDLNGLAVQGTMRFDFVSDEFSVEGMTAVLPGLFTAEAPLGLTGSSRTGLGVAVPPLDLAAVRARLAEPTALEEGTAARVATLALGLEESGEPGLPVRLSIPRLTTESGTWSDIEGTMRVGTQGLALENVRAAFGGGEVAIRGQVARGNREGTVTARSVPLGALEELWGSRWPGEVHGQVDGRFAGTALEGQGLLQAALDGSLHGAQIAEQWLLEEIADYTGLESLRAWEGAEVTVLAAMDGEGWSLGHVELAQAETRLRLGGRIAADESLEIGALVTVPARVAERRASDPLFALAEGDGDGGVVVALSVTGRVSAPVIQPVELQAAEALIGGGRGAHLVSVFNALRLALPEGLVNLPAEQPAPPSAAAPASPVALPATAERITEEVPPLSPIQPRPAPEPEPLPTPEVAPAPPPRAPMPEPPVSAPPVDRRPARSRPQLPLPAEPPQPPPAPAPEPDDGTRQSEIVE